MSTEHARALSCVIVLNVFYVSVCDVLPQPIWNRFIYHTDFILCHSYYLLFNCLNYSSRHLKYTAHIHSHTHTHTSRLIQNWKQANEWHLLGFYLKLFECWFSRSATKIHKHSDKKQFSFGFVRALVNSLTHNLFLPLFWLSFLSMLLKNGISTPPYYLNFLVRLMPFRHFTSLTLGLSLWEVFRKLIY